MPVHLPDEPPLDEAHWPILLSIVAARLMTQMKDAVEPGPALALMLEVGAGGVAAGPRTDRSRPLEAAPGRAGLQIAKAERFRRLG